MKMWTENEMGRIGKMGGGEMGKWAELIRELSYQKNIFFWFKKILIRAGPEFLRAGSKISAHVQAYN